MTGLVMIKGAGDIATGVAHRLHRAGFGVVMTELPEPLCVRRTVSFAEAVHCGSHTIEDVTAVRADTEAEIRQALDKGLIPVTVDPEARRTASLPLVGLVDAILAKRNTGTSLTDAPIVVGLGPGFVAGVDCHAVVETQRGHDLGRVYYHGTAAPDTGVPGEIGGETVQRVLRAPCAGVFWAGYQISDRVTPGAAVGHVVASDGTVTVVETSIGGIVRGMLRDGTRVSKGLKVGDVDPLDIADHCFTISDKARAVAGGVLEALLNPHHF